MTFLLVWVGTVTHRFDKITTHSRIRRRPPAERPVGNDYRTNHRAKKQGTKAGHRRGLRPFNSNGRQNNNGPNVFTKFTHKRRHPDVTRLVSNSDRLPRMVYNGHPAACHHTRMTAITINKGGPIGVGNRHYEE